MTHPLDTCVLAFVKKSEVYVYVYNRDTVCEMSLVLSRQRDDPELSLTRRDAEEVWRRIWESLFVDSN